MNQCDGCIHKEVCFIHFVSPSGWEWNKYAAEMCENCTTTPERCRGCKHQPKDLDEHCKMFKCKERRVP